MIDHGMVLWHFIGFTLVVTGAMWVLKLLLPGVQGFARFVLFGLVLAGTWFAHSHYYVQSGPFLRDTVLAPILGKRRPADRLAYVLEAKAWQKPEIRRELLSVSVFERPGKALQLAYQGIPRLGDSSQARWLQLVAHLAELGKDSECSPLGRGEVTAEMWFRMLNRLTEAEIREFYNLSLEAVVAGTAPASAVAPATDTNAIMQGLMASLPPHEQVRFRDAALSMQARGDKDACWMVKTMFAGFARLPFASRVALLQTFAKEASQKSAVTTARVH